jgi:hypothetical protein
LIAHFGDFLLVEVSEKVQLEDTFSYVRSTHKIDLEKLGLEMAFIGSVALESLKENCSSLLNSLVLEEDLYNTIERSLRLTRSITHGNHLGKVDCSLRVLGHNSSENLHEVGLVSSLLAVRKDFIELVSFDKTLEDSVWASTFLENLQSESRVVLSHKISKLV